MKALVLASAVPLAVELAGCMLVQKMVTGRRWRLLQPLSLRCRDRSPRLRGSSHSANRIGTLLHQGVANDVWDRKSRGADLYRDQHHLRYRNAPSHQLSLVGIARHLRCAVVGR